MNVQSQSLLNIKYKYPQINTYNVKYHLQIKLFRMRLRLNYAFHSYNIQTVKSDSVAFFRRWSDIHDVVVDIDRLRWLNNSMRILAWIGHCKQRQIKIVIFKRFTKIRFQDVRMNDI